MSLVSINDVLKITTKVEKIHPYKVVGDRDSYSPYNEGWSDCVSLIESYLEKLPFAEPEPEEFEWCHDCKEYDQEKHCCHRWTKVIRQTVEEVKRQYALDYPKIIHCENCKFYTPMNRKLKTGICSLTMHHLGDEGFCSDAEMRGDHE